MLRLFGKRRSKGNSAVPAETPVTTPPRVRAPQTTVSLDWLLGLTGELADDAPSSVRFRENVESPNIKLKEIETWILQALVHPLDEYRILALQDLVNSIGKRLGFGVTYGNYKKDPADWLQFDGLWRIENDLFATIDVYSVRLEGIDIKGLAQASTKLRASNKLLGKSELLHLFVLCEDYDPGIEESIRMSGLHGSIRLLPITTLFEILKMFEDLVVSPQQLPYLFRPYDNIGIHNVVLFLEQFIAGYQEPVHPDAMQPPTPLADENDSTADLNGLQQAHSVRAEADANLSAPLDFDGVVAMLERGEAGPDLLAEFLNTHPEDLAAAEYYASFVFPLGDEEAAIATLEKVLETEPTRESALVKLVDILKRRQDFAKALGVVERAQPNLPRTLELSHAELLLLAGRSNDSRAACESILAKEPNRPDVYRLMGYAFEHEKAFEESLACFEKAATLSPSDTESRRRIAIVRKKIAKEQPLTAQPESGHVDDD